MEIAGAVQATNISYSTAVLRECRKLLQLQGELVVQLIESARVPAPRDGFQSAGLGEIIDIRV